MRRSRAGSGLESAVLACLAAADCDLTPSQVQARLGRDLAYTTVMTTLARLHAKQALSREPRGRAYAYRLVGGSDGAQAGIAAHRMQQLLSAGPDTATVLSRFVDGLDPGTEQILRELLAAQPERPS